MKESRNRKPRQKDRFIGSTLSEKHKVRYVWLKVSPDDLWLEVRQGETVWEALRKAGVELGGECGGLGKCGKCKVKVLSSLGPPSKEERELLDEEELKQGIRLACRTTIEKDLVVYIGETKPDLEYHQILRSGHRPLVQLEPLVNKRLTTLPPDLRDNGLSDLDRVKLALGPEYQDLRASLHCLRSLPQILKETRFHGAAVLHEDLLLAWQGREKMEYQYGLVFDVGTTTLVGKLINLQDGSEVAAICRLNSQIKYGSDVISRLQYVKEHANGLGSLHHLLIEDLNHIIKRLLEVGGLEPNDIFVAVAAGNTTMQHLLLRLPPHGIAEAPFSPVVTDGLIVRAADVGLQLHPDALLYTMPMKSGYIGGDLISVVLASGAAEQEDEIILGLDLGTNGEIFLGNGKRLMTCSAAAGPALEGARIAYGMIAKAGAIGGVGFDEGDFHYMVIGNIKPKGICGSGLVDLVADLLELGIIDDEGLIRPPQGGIGKGLSPRIISRSGVNDFLIASAEESYGRRPLYLTQKDVRELQLAKAAIAAGIETLMDEMGVGIQDIHRVYLAGAFGNYVNPYSAIRIGLLPDITRQIISSLGNAASTGASMVLLSRDYWRKANELAGFIEHVELSSRLDFNQYFIGQMDFPKGRAPEVHREEVGEVMKAIRVGEVMTRDFPTVPVTMATKEIANLSRNTGHHGFPVLDEQGRLFGVVTLADLERALRNGNADLPVGEVATQVPLVAYPDQSLYEVLQATAEDYGRIPVVDRQDRDRLVGVLRRHDIIRAYREELTQTGESGKGFAEENPVV